MGNGAMPIGPKQPRPSSTLHFRPGIHSAFVYGCQILLVQFRSEHYRARYLNHLVGSRIAIPVGGKGMMYGAFVEAAALPFLVGIAFGLILKLPWSARPLAATFLVAAVSLVLDGTAFGV